MKRALDSNVWNRTYNALEALLDLAKIYQMTLLYMIFASNAKDNALAETVVLPVITDAFLFDHHLFFVRQFQIHRIWLQDSL